MEPTKKSKAIDSLLSSMTGMSRHTALARGRCIWCKKEAREFRDAVSTKEYRISGLCQKCQDEVFGKGEGNVL